MLPTLLLLSESNLELPTISPKLFTAPVAKDADDPAIIERGARTLILATDKAAAPDGGLYVFDLHGKVVSQLSGLDRPNNVDILSGFFAGSRKVDLALVTERFQRRVRIFEISESGRLEDISGTAPTFPDWPEADREPMGITCGRIQGQDFVWISPKTGPKADHFQRATLAWNPVTKKVDMKHEAYFGFFSGIKETESLAVDTNSNRLYCADEGVGIWVFEATTGMPKGLIANPLHIGDHEGLGIWTRPSEKLLVNSDQRPTENVFWIYTLPSLTVKGGFRAKVDETDGLEVCAKPLGNQFPAGILVAMNSKDKNFAIFDLRDIATAIGK